MLSLIELFGKFKISIKIVTFRNFFTKRRLAFQVDILILTAVTEGSARSSPKTKILRLLRT